MISRKNFIACSKIVLVQFNRPGDCSPEKDCSVVVTDVLKYFSFR